MVRRANMMAAVNYGYCSENSRGGKLLCTLCCQLLGQCQRMHCFRVCGRNTWKTNSFSDDQWNSICNKHIVENVTGKVVWHKGLNTTHYKWWGSYVHTHTKITFPVLTCPPAPSPPLPTYPWTPSHSFPPHNPSQTCTWQRVHGQVFPIDLQYTEVATAVDTQ